MGLRSKEEKWMLYALKEANNALIKDEVPIGSIIVKNNVIMQSEIILFID